MRERETFVLIPAIMLLMFAAIAVLGLSFFITERLKSAAAANTTLQSTYLAEAGIHDCLYWYRYQGYFSLGPTVITSGDSYAIDGDEAGLLLVDARNTNRQQIVRLVRIDIDVDNFYVDNVTGSQDLTITRMVVNWVNYDLCRLRTIGIGGSTKWSGNSLSPANCNISDTAVSAGDNHEVHFYFISRSFWPSLTPYIDVRFVMNDGTYKELRVYPASADGYKFTFNSEGLKAAGGFSISAAIEAEYHVSADTITDYKKIQN